MSSAGRDREDQGELEAAIELGRRFRARRHELGLTQGQVAAKANLHRSTIGALERGGTHITVTTVVLAAVALGRRPEAMLTGISWEPGSGTWHVERAAVWSDSE